MVAACVCVCVSVHVSMCVCIRVCVCVGGGRRAGSARATTAGRTSAPPPPPPGIIIFSAAEAVCGVRLGGAAAHSRPRPGSADRAPPGTATTGMFQTRTQKTRGNRYIMSTRNLKLSLRTVAGSARRGAAVLTRLTRSSLRVKYVYHRGSFHAHGHTSFSVW